MFPILGGGNKKLRHLWPGASPDIGLTPVPGIGQARFGPVLYAGCLQSMRHGLQHRLQLLRIVGLLGHSNGYYDLLLAHHRLGIVALHVSLPGLHDATVRVGGISLRLFGREWFYHLGLSPPLLFACGLFFCPPLLHMLLDSLGSRFIRQ